ncbi:MAG: DUF6197 family protein [Geminicoccaceae bacterium]
MTPREILIAAKAKIEDPERWCQGWFARDIAGHPIGSRNPGACKWCSLGAIRVVWGPLSYESKVLQTLAVAALDQGFQLPEDLNDNTDHPTVMKMFDRAIELAGEAE